MHVCVYISIYIYIYIHLSDLGRALEVEEASACRAAFERDSTPFE